MSLEVVQAQLEESWVGPFNVLQWGILLALACLTFILFGADMRNRVRGWLASVREFFLPDAMRKQDAAVVAYRPLEPELRRGPEALHATMLENNIDVKTANEFVKTHWETILGLKQPAHAEDGAK